MSIASIDAAITIDLPCDVVVASVAAKNSTVVPYFARDVVVASVASKDSAARDLASHVIFASVPAIDAAVVAELADPGATKARAPVDRGRHQLEPVNEASFKCQLQSACCIALAASLRAGAIRWP